MTVDLCSVYLLSGVDIVVRYIEVDFTFGLLDYVRYIFYVIPFNVTLDVKYRSSYRRLRILTTLTRDIQCESLLRMRQSVVTCTMYPDTDP